MITKQTKTTGMTAMDLKNILDRQLRELDELNMDDKNIMEKIHKAKQIFNNLHKPQCLGIFIFLAFRQKFLLILKMIKSISLLDS